jgi:hypothetical protein
MNSESLVSSGKALRLAGPILRWALLSHFSMHSQRAIIPDFEPSVIVPFSPLLVYSSGIVAVA